MNETTYEEINKLKETMKTFEELKTKEWKLINYIAQCEYDINKIETTIRGVIACEKDPATNKPLFSNEAMREGELLRVLGDTQQHKDLIHVVADSKDQLRIVQGEISIHNNFITTMRMIIDLRKEV